MYTLCIEYSNVSLTISITVCIANCLTCPEGVTTCASCAAPYYLKGTQCVMAGRCNEDSEGLYQNDDTRTCDGM